jgi:ABC-type transport system involved in cytochrome c biogenesis permease subunit
MGITHFCFGLSYLVAFGLELARLAWPSRGLRWLSLGFGLAGVLSQTVFVAYHQPTPASPYGSLLLLAWILAIFYIIGALKPKLTAWSLFSLFVLLNLVWLSFAFLKESKAPIDSWFSGHAVWGMVHGGFVLAASVGITAGFLASLLYLVQSYRLKRKLPPISFLGPSSLERLERVNRRSINLALPLLTVGIIMGSIRLQGQEDGTNWTAVKILATGALWLTGMLLVLLRYWVQLPGRRLAWLTILSFFLLIVSLVASHPYAVTGEGR